MIETPEHASTYEKKQKSPLDYVKRYQAAHRDLVKRADELKGKDEPRRRELLKKAAAMKKGRMTTNQVRRSAIYAELDLFLDDERHKGGKGYGSKK